jgi:endonuclease YncB( thermonuclease family)
MTIRRKIKRSVDGDTLELYRKLQGSKYIRLAGVNAPEKGEKGYNSAKKKLNNLGDKTVTLKPKGRSYGRIVADVRYKRRKINKGGKVKI